MGGMKGFGRAGRPRGGRCATRLVTDRCQYFPQIKMLFASPQFPVAIRQTSAVNCLRQLVLSVSSSKAAHNDSRLAVSSKCQRSPKSQNKSHSQRPEGHVH